MSQEQYLKSPCAHCNGRISFPASARGLTVTCPHCGQQTVLNASADAPPNAPAAEAAPPAPAEPAAAKPAARAVATAQARPVAAKPLSDVQKAALAAARAANPVARPAGAKPVDKKRVVVKAQWADGEDEDQPASKPLRCDFCGTKIPPGATKCPDCGTAVAARPEARPSWFRRIGLALVLVLALVAAGRWGQYYLSIRPKKGKDGKPLKEGVEILNHALQPQPGTALLYVRGTVTNHADVPWFDVKVQCELLDKTGASLGKFSDSKIVLDPHKVFPFSIALLDPDAKAYTNITVSAQR
ncbi:MAG: transcriptional regulator [Limisphaerales bacterium]|nr:MAG: transcriptional regulator [Limisphaerales bacterium]KAG0507583.1 MAG: transcriptional regulator [Limisphaerales bacterium]TXT48548.1 MAG: transcriptional regulator [Limisphaerales bacterium]